jgi:hypothetical protein
MNNICQLSASLIKAPLYVSRLALLCALMAAATGVLVGCGPEDGPEGKNPPSWYEND